MKRSFYYWYRELVYPVITPLRPTNAEMLRVFQMLIDKDAYGRWYKNLSIEEKTNPTILMKWLDFHYPETRSARDWEQSFKNYSEE